MPVTNNEPILATRPIIENPSQFVRELLDNLPEYCDGALRCTNWKYNACKFKIVDVVREKESTPGAATHGQLIVHSTTQQRIYKMEEQDWVIDENHPSFEENGCFELWMSFGGVTCGTAFDAGYDAGFKGTKECPYQHPALIQAWAAGMFEMANNDEG